MDAQPPRVAPLPVGERRENPRRRLEDATALLVRAVDRYDHDLRWRQQGWNAHALVIAVRHNESTDEPRRDAPARVPGKFLRSRFCLELQIKDLREILAEIVRRTSLQGLVVLHHRFTRVRAERAGESLGLRL